MGRTAVVEIGADIVVDRCARDCVALEATTRLLTAATARTRKPRTATC
jgi:hypothetical protein